MSITTQGNSDICHGHLMCTAGLTVFWGMQGLILTNEIADVAVTKRHQRLNEIRIIFIRTSFKSCFQKSSVMQYTPSTLNAIQFAQRMLAHML